MKPDNELPTRSQQSNIPTDPADSNRRAAYDSKWKWNGFCQIVKDTPEIPARWKFLLYLSIPHVTAMTAMAFRGAPPYAYGFTLVPFVLVSLLILFQKFEK